MTYFPEPVFRNIASFLVDPYKRDREAHAEVWRKIRVKRCVGTTSGVYEDDTEEHQCAYFVYVYDPSICGSDDASIPTANFGPDDIQPDEWDNVEQIELYNPYGANFPFPFA